MRRVYWGAFPLILIGGFLGAPASASQLIINGGFETGDLSGWTASTELGSGGELLAWNSTADPFSGLTTVGPDSGNFFALTDQNDEGAYSLAQSFTVVPGATVILSFDFFANSYATVSTPDSLDFNTPNNEQARVDLLTGSAGAFDLDSAVLANFYDGADSGTNPNPYTFYSFDISSLVAAGGTYQIRFAEVDNQDNFNMGVDNVSITEATGAPEPAPSGIVLAGLVGMAVAFRRYSTASPASSVSTQMSRRLR